MTFLGMLTEGRKQRTRHGRYSHLKAFFNFIKANLDPTLLNPCDTPVLRKLYRPGKSISWKIVEKDAVDEIIFRTTKVRNRIMLELMARGGMRIGEVLNLTSKDVDDVKLTIQHPKSGSGTEIVFIPRKVAERLRGYIVERGIDAGNKIFPITYAAARVMVKKAGELVGIELRPHDLRRHAATKASRSGVPIEIVSKIILRHALRNHRRSLVQAYSFGNRTTGCATTVVTYARRRCFNGHTVRCAGYAQCRRSYCLSFVQRGGVEGLSPL